MTISRGIWRAADKSFKGHMRPAGRGLADAGLLENIGVESVCFTGALAERDLLYLWTYDAVSEQKRISTNFGLFLSSPLSAYFFLNYVFLLFCFRLDYTSASKWQWIQAVSKAAIWEVSTSLVCFFCAPIEQLNLASNLNYWQSKKVLKVSMT